MNKQVGTVMVIVACIAATAGTWAADKPKVDTPDRGFEGKALLIQGGTPGSRFLFIMDQPQMRRLGDRWFIVGKAHSITLGDPAWAVTWCSVESATVIKEFATLKELDDHLARAPALIK